MIMVSSHGASTRSHDRVATATATATADADAAAATSAAPPTLASGERVILRDGERRDVDDRSY